MPLREGADIQEFTTRAPRLFADPSRFPRHLRRDWKGVAILVRQTARFPIAAAADGTAFRNSLLAGFETEAWPRALLLCLLNSSLVRWLHYTRFRDARQGMPQVKIGHLRSLPAPVFSDPASRAELLATGERLIAGNAGFGPGDRDAIDQVVFRWYGLSPQQCAMVQSWWAGVRTTR